MPDTLPTSPVLPPYIYGREASPNEKVWTEASVLQLVASLSEATPARQSLTPMGENNDEWYFDCDGHYIDVKRDVDGTFSVFFKNRAGGAAAWLDQAEQAAKAHDLLVRARFHLNEHGSEYQHRRQDALIAEIDAVLAGSTSQQGTAVVDGDDTIANAYQRDHEKAVRAIRVACEYTPELRAAGTITPASAITLLAYHLGQRSDDAVPASVGTTLLRLLQDYVISEEDCNSVEFDAIFGRYSIAQLLKELESRLAHMEQDIPLDFLAPLYQWMARAKFERPADELTAAGFAENIKAAIAARNGATDSVPPAGARLDLPGTVDTHGFDLMESCEYALLAKLRDTLDLGPCGAEQLPTVIPHTVLTFAELRVRRLDSQLATACTALTAIAESWCECRANASDVAKSALEALAPRDLSAIKPVTGASA